MFKFLLLRRVKRREKTTPNTKYSLKRLTATVAYRVSKLIKATSASFSYLII
jgi:hypothetical protein